MELEWWLVECEACGWYSRVLVDRERRCPNCGGQVKRGASAAWRRAVGIEHARDPHGSPGGQLVLPLGPGGLTEGAGATRQKGPLSL
jgi:PHP family Zn ribbon phosphoesterase